MRKKSPLSSRQQREVILKLEGELTEEREKEVAPVIEDILAEVPPMPIQEQLLVAMNTKKLKNSRTKRERPHQIAARDMEPGEARRTAMRAAAQAALILGQPPNVVAAQYGIPLAKAEEWKDIIGFSQAIARRDQLNHILMAFIQQEFVSLMAISMVTSREEWIMVQSAGDLADYVAVKADRVLSLLAAFGRTQESVKQLSAQLEDAESDG